MEEANWRMQREKSQPKEEKDQRPKSIEQKLAMIKMENEQLNQQLDYLRKIHHNLHKNNETLAPVRFLNYTGQANSHEALSPTIKPVDGLTDSCKREIALGKSNRIMKMNSSSEKLIQNKENLSPNMISTQRALDQNKLGPFSQKPSQVHFQNGKRPFGHSFKPAKAEDSFHNEEKQMERTTTSYLQFKSSGHLARNQETTLKPKESPLKESPLRSKDSPSKNGLMGSKNHRLSPQAFKSLKADSSSIFSRRFSSTEDSRGARDSQNPLKTSTEDKIPFKTPMSFDSSSPKASESEKNHMRQHGSHQNSLNRMSLDKNETNSTVETTPQSLRAEIDGIKHWISGYSATLNGFSQKTLVPKEPKGSKDKKIVLMSFKEKIELGEKEKGKTRFYDFLKHRKSTERNAEKAKEQKEKARGLESSEDALNKMETSESTRNSAVIQANQNAVSSLEGARRTQDSQENLAKIKEKNPEKKKKKKVTFELENQKIRDPFQESIGVSTEEATSILKAVKLQKIWKDQWILLFPLCSHAFLYLCLS